MSFAKIGILGGLGSAATARFFSALIAKAQADGCVDDLDFPEVVLYNKPLTGFDETGIVDHDLVLQGLLAGIAFLEASGCEVIAIPCNTVHVCIDEIKASTVAQVVDLVDEIEKALFSKAAQTVGVLGSETTMASGLFSRVANSVLIPTAQQQEQVTALIHAVMGGTITPAGKADVVSVVNAMQAAGADAILLGCTELPLAISQEDLSLPVVDSLSVLSEATLQCAKKESLRPVHALISTQGFVARRNA